MGTFDNIFKAVEKAVSDDPLASLHKAGDITISSYIPFAIPTGIPELDFNIRRPGWPAGRCIELFGFEHCGKTTLAYQAIAQAQRMGGGGFFIDTEKSWDERRATQCGVNVNVNFGIGDADSVEAAFRLVRAIIDARLDNNDGSPFIVAIDSITGTATEHMKSTESGGEERIGQDARAIRGGMRRITEGVAKAKITLIMINHAISTIPKFKFAKQSEAAGGHAIKLFSTIRINLANLGWITEGADKRRIGQKVTMKIDKLKNSSMEYPDLKEVQLLNTIGFDTLNNLLDAGMKAGWIDHAKGSKDYSFEGVSFPKKDWEIIVEERGGLDAMYKEFLDWCIANGKMEKWGSEG